MHDVDPQLYPSVIREMFRHENDVTNHRIMWLLIVQGLIANAAVTAGRESGESASALAAVGILVTLSAFVILYKSYQARGYLQFLGGEAKQGTLREQDLPLFGWPGKRIRGWRKKVWPCPWIGKDSDLLEPFFFLPTLLISAWLFVLLRQWLALRAGVLIALSTILALVMISLFCIVLVWWGQKDEEQP
jgi:amino acid transporter